MNRKLIFDTVRKLIGRGFTGAEVAMLDRAIDAAIRIDPAAPPPAPCIGGEGITLIKTFEGCARKREDGLFEAYPDPGTGDEPWTIGWGATHMSGRKVCREDIISQAEADALLEEHLARYAAEVVRALAGAPTSPAQFDALVSFHYNTGAIARATLTRKHCAGDYAGAAREFRRWNKAGGRVMRGLTRRREAEAALYLQGC